MPIPLLVPGLVLILAAAQVQDGAALLQQGVAQLRQGAPEQARATFEAALAVFRAQGNVQGQAGALAALGNTLTALGDQRRALEAYAEAAQAFHALGAARYEAIMIGSVGTLAVDLGDQERAASCFEQAITTARAAGDVQAEIAGLSRLAMCLGELKREDRIPALLERAVGLADAAGAPDGAGLAYSAQGTELRRRGRPREALEAYRKAAEKFHEAGDADGEGFALTGLGSVQDFFGEKLRALDAYQRALPLLQAAGNVTQTILTVRGLTGLYADTGELEQALAYARNGLERTRAAKDVLGEAASLGMLGILQDRTGHGAEGLALCQQALKTFQALGDGRGEAWLQGVLGAFYADFKDPERSDRCNAAALEGFRRNRDALGEAGQLDAMGANLARAGDPGAEARFLEALALFRKASNQYGEVQVLDHLGGTYENLGQNARALSYYEQALPLEQALGSRAMEARTLLSLGVLYGRLGRLDKALSFLGRALELDKAQRDPAGQAMCLLAEALILARQKRAGESLPRFAEGARLQKQVAEAAFPALGEGRKLDYLHQFEALQHAFLTLVASRFTGDPGAVRSCFDAWLGFKGNVLEAQGKLHGALAASQDPKVRELRSGLLEARQTRARLFQGGGAGAERELKAAQDRVDALEAALGQASGAFALDREAAQVDSAALARLLPAGTAFLDFARIGWLDFDREDWTGYRYVAFLFRPEGGGRVTLADLGPAPPVDAALEELRARILAGGSVADVLDRLHRLLLKPLEPGLEGARRLLVSPDGPLDLLPFELLAPRGGPSLMDRFQLSYVNAGRDLARFQAPPAAARTVAILADPDFEGTGTPAAPRTEGRASRDLRGLRFEPLPGTRKEAEGIRGLFPAADVVCLLGPDATEARLEALQAPRILHLATHGYFLGPQAGAGPDASRGLKVTGRAVRPDLRVENPMLRSGLALAGANVSIGKGEDEGLVCAEKVLGMNLFGTDLVVLSACNTGVGKVADGEGVFGLERAFVLAGARSLVVSLWPVPDRETRVLMEAFYRNLAAGEPKVQALREAKRTVAARMPHPFYWAAFVLVGKPD